MIPLPPRSTVMGKAYKNQRCTGLRFFIGLLLCSLLIHPGYAQNTIIRGFVAAESTLQNGKLSFGFGEQDLFITSQLSDRFSFLGESVFKYDAESNTEFSVSIERVVLKYNIGGNHNILIGKHHTPLNYWNDTYHHGRLFFPTIERPLLFSAGIIPIHTTGVDFQGLNLGALRFGYDLMIGNGLGSSDVADNDKFKSWTMAVHIKPVDRLRIGASYYNDVISAGAKLHDRIIDKKVNQQLFSGSVAYFGKKFELLAEGTLASNKTDTLGRNNTTASYIYGGIKLTEKWIPYVRADFLNYKDGSYYFKKNDASSFLVGIRYQLNYLAVVKLEYQYQDWEMTGTSNRLMLQVAVGF